MTNSPLTETSVLAFEFGYSLEEQKGLVVWEAQFGDFANVAQVIIDQFIVSSEGKWGQSSGLCLLLPHGLEGDGPEHSSARPERFLQLCAENNIEIVQLTTASQIFHKLRLQALKIPRKPLVIFTPKHHLQHSSTTSSIDEFCQGSFHKIIVDECNGNADQVILCSGNFFSELKNESEKRQANVTIVRLEQWYPFPQNELKEAINRSSPTVPLTWIQEEPENMGAWRWLQPQLEVLKGRHSIRAITRPAKSSPASGSLAQHNKEQRELIEKAFSKFK
ncbi:hypothetical protein OAM01_02645 [bacterium]|nr:hypothetical protein [bacterium]